MTQPSRRNPLTQLWSAIQQQYQSAASPTSFLQMAEEQFGLRQSQSPSGRADERIPIPRGVSRPRQDFSSVERRDCLYWGGHWVPIASMQHAVSLGSPGSGKTLHGSCTFASAVQAVLSCSGRKLIVFDTKGDYRRFLEGMQWHWQLPIYYQVMNISDLLCSAWDIAADFNEYARLYELGYLLFPVIRGENAFFQDGSRAISIAVMSSFTYRHGQDWTMADLYNALTSDLDTLIEIVKGFPRGEDIIHLLLKTQAGETLDNIRMTVQTQVERLRIPAAHVQKTQDSLVSLREFLASPNEQILLISQDLTAKAVAQPILRSAFNRLSDFINARDGVEIAPDTFIFLDELEFIGELPGLQDVANFARGKGLILFLISQTLEGLHRVYGKEAAESILSDCPYKAFFRSDSLQTAQWVQNLVGQQEIWETQWQASYSAQGVNVTRNRQRKLEHPVLSSDLRKLPKPTLDAGLTGMFLSEEYGDEPWKTLPSHELTQLIPPTAEFSTRPLTPADQIIDQWSPAERAKYVSGRSWERGPEPTPEAIAQPTLSLFEKDLRGEIFDLFEAQALPLIEDALRGRLNREV